MSTNKILIYLGIGFAIILAAIIAVYFLTRSNRSAVGPIDNSQPPSSIPNTQPTPGPSGIVPTSPSAAPAPVTTPPPTPVPPVNTNRYGNAPQFTEDQYKQFNKR